MTRPPGTSFLLRVDLETAEAVRVAAKKSKVRYSDWIWGVLRERLELPPLRIPDETGDRTCRKCGDNIKGGTECLSCADERIRKSPDLDQLTEVDLDGF